MHIKAVKAVNEFEPEHCRVREVVKYIKKSGGTMEGQNILQ